MLYSIAKLLFVLSSRSLTRQFKISLSKRKNQVFLKRAHDIDEYLIKTLEDVRAAAETHVWNVNEKAGDVDSGYMQLLSKNVRDAHRNYLHYAGAESGVPFKPISYGSLISEVDEGGMFFPSSPEEAQEKIDVLASGYDEYGDTQQEQ